MNREDIIRMAREAGASTEIKHVTVGNGDGIVFTPDELARFANRVAARAISSIDPSKFMSHREGFEAGATTEREACAKVCERIAADNYGELSGRTIPEACARAIRARGEKT
jgi:hypothetical protein